jgi:pimeloyl-ACP methyl ester carboxylesterase
MFGFAAAASAQSGVTGTWRTQGVGAGTWTVDLRADGSRLTGRVIACTSLPVEIADGRIQGNTITFRCQSGDGDRVISFTGTMNGDTIALAWKQEVRAGGAAHATDTALDPQDLNAREMFGTSTPPAFSVTRIPDRGLEFAAALNLPNRGIKAEGTLFIPRDVSRVRAVVVLFSAGLSWDGLGGSFYRDAQLRSLAQQLGCALLLPRITNIVQTDRGLGSIDTLRNAGAGGADALVALLQRLGEESGHRELADAPVLLWGNSRTGHFVATFAALHPQRTIAFVQYHTGGPGLEMNGLREIPALLLEAKGDIATNKSQAQWPADFFSETGWKRGRAAGAPWTFGIEPNASHINEKDLPVANALVIPWIAAVLQQRLSPGGKALRVVSGASGWLGDLNTHEIAPLDTFVGAARAATWLPDEASARGWRIVVGATK